MQPLFLKALDAQHCVAEGFMEFVTHSQPMHYAPSTVAVPACVNLLPPPPLPHTTQPTQGAMLAAVNPPVDTQLTWEEAADIIATVRIRSEK